MKTPVLVSPRLLFWLAGVWFLSPLFGVPFSVLSRSDLFGVCLAPWQALALRPRMVLNCSALRVVLMLSWPLSPCLRLGRAAVLKSVLSVDALGSFFRSAFPLRRSLEVFMSGCYERCSYRGFSIYFEPKIGFCFSDGATEWAARSPAHAVLRIDAILRERNARASAAAVAASGFSAVL